MAALLEPGETRAHGVGSGRTPTAARRLAPILISGRPAHEVAALLGIDPPPEIWGCHGWERLQPDGSFRRIAPPWEAVRALRRAFHEAQDLVPPDTAVAGYSSGTRVEDKGAAVAIHTRGLDARTRTELESQLRERLGSLAENVPSVILLDFDGGLELRACGRDKGSAVEEILAEAPGGARVTYLGDDLTDEDAFRAIRSRGGLGVLVREELRPTEADLWIRPPEGLLDFLDRWIEAVSVEG
jgi:trehalose-phosphatase